MRRIIRFSLFSLLCLCLTTCTANCFAQQSDVFGVQVSENDRSEIVASIEMVVGSMDAFIEKTLAEVETAAAFDKQLVNKVPLDIMNIKPDEDDIDLQTALLIAYVHVMQTYELKQDDLAQYMPTVRFLYFMGNIEWNITLNTITEEMWEKHGGFSVYIDSKTGEINRVDTKSNAVG